MKTELWAIGLVLLATVLGSLGPLFLKKASDKLTFNIKSILANYNILLGFFFYGIGTILFIPALKGGDLSVLYPMIAFVHVLVCLLSVKFLNERMNKLKWIGISLIILGVTFIGLGA